MVWLKPLGIQKPDSTGLLNTSWCHTSALVMCGQWGMVWLRKPSLIWHTVVGVVPGVWGIFIESVIVDVVGMPHQPFGGGCCGQYLHHWLH